MIHLWMWSFTACIIPCVSNTRTTNTTPDSKVIILGISNIFAFYIIINSRVLIVLFLAFIRLVKITMKITVTQQRLCFDRKSMTFRLIIAQYCTLLPCINNLPLCRRAAFITMGYISRGDKNTSTHTGLMFRLPLCPIPVSPSARPQISVVKLSNIL